MCRVSIVVVVWNGERYLQNCLESVVSCQEFYDEVIVADNGSVDGSVELVRRYFPQVRVIELRRNLGFAGGANAGISVARGEIIILLNQDVIMHPGWLSALMEPFADRGVGIVGCKLLYPDGRIQHAGGWIAWPLGLPNHFGYEEADEGQWDEERPVDYVTGAIFGLRRSVLEQIGLFDEGFWPGYYEEVDYCFRARKAGWKVIYTPRCVGIHLESVSLGRGSQAYLEAIHKGRLRFVLKHLNPLLFIREFLPAEENYLEESSPLLCQALRRAYLITMLSTVPDILGNKGEEETLRQILDGLSRLYSLSVEASMRSDELGADQRLPLLQEFRFPSRVPVVGPLISLMRRLLYNLTAKWAIRFLIQQQNQINQTIEAWLREQEALFIDLDRDLALLARRVAEIEIRQRQLMREVAAPTQGHRQEDV